MLDCPEQNQTSPTMTSRKVTDDFAETTRSKGPPAPPAGNSRVQLPSASAVAKTFASRNLPEMSAPGAAVPEMRTGLSRCRTMWSP